MQKPTNEQIVEVLKGSLKYLSPTRYDLNGKNEYICWSMMKFEELKHGTDEVTKYIQEMVIYPRIEGNVTLRCWLSLQGIPEHELQQQNGKLMQIHRRQWVEQLIKEFSS